MTVADPKIGKASTNPIPTAAINGNGTGSPAHLKMVSPC